jgi:hypothetical protein
MTVLLWLIIITCILAYFIHNLETHIENFDESLENELTILAKDAFPCQENSDPSKRSGCFYKDLGGCIMFDTNSTSGVCPQSAALFSQQMASQNAASSDPSPHNEGIFEFVYDAMKNTTPSTQCPDRLSSSCPLNFFKNITVMTDGEINQYISRLSSEPCSEGAICLRPENVAAFISQQRSALNFNDPTICKNSQQLKSEIKNTFSQGIHDRVFDKCTQKNDLT